MTRFGHKLNYVINTFVKHTPGLQANITKSKRIGGNILRQTKAMSKLSAAETSKDRITGCEENRCVIVDER